MTRLLACLSLFGIIFSGAPALAHESTRSGVPQKILDAKNICHLILSQNQPADMDTLHYDVAFVVCLAHELTGTGLDQVLLDAVQTGNPDAVVSVPSASEEASISDRN
jgi:hypothetical protein